MKCVIVVLALSGLCAAVPEADPQLLLSNAFGPSVIGGPLAPFPLLRSVPAPLPVVRTAAFPVPVVRSFAPVAVVPARGLTPRDCVTASGCAVRVLKDAGLAPGRFRREAEAEPQFFAPAPYALNPYYSQAGLPAYAPAFYNNIGYNNYGYSNYGYNLYNNYAPLVASVPAPIVRALPAPSPIVRAIAAPVVQTVVEQHTKPVTYTHLGAHPIQPTTVLETDTVVRHVL